MKGRWFALLLAASAVLLLIGCSEGLMLGADPGDGPVSARAAAGSKAVVHSATGNGHTITGIGSRGQATWFWGYNAHQYADGTFGGTVNISDHYFEAKGRTFQVVYLSVDDSDPDSKKALIVDYGELPPEWGGGYYYMAYVVTDNGEGANDPPDVHSWGFALPEADPAMQPYIARLLSTTPEGFFEIVGELYGGTEESWTLTVDMGNIQVR